MHPEWNECPQRRYARVSAVAERHTTHSSVLAWAEKVEATRSAESTNRARRYTHTSGRGTRLKI